MGLLHQVGTVRAARSHAGLLHSGINRKRRSAGQRGDIQKLPASGQCSSQRPQKPNSIERQHLDQAEGERVSRVES